MFFVRNHVADQVDILCGAFLGSGINIILFTIAWSHDQPSWVVALIFCSRYLGHMTKMAATPIYVKTSSKIFFSRTNWRIQYSKFGMYHLGLQPIIVCSNDEPGMTCFMASSILETKAFTWEKCENNGYFGNCFSLRRKKNRKVIFYKITHMLSRKAGNQLSLSIA